MATGCDIKINMYGATHDLRQNKALGKLLSVQVFLFTKGCIGDEVARVTKSRYGTIDYEWGIKSASTDFVSSPCCLC